MHIHVSIQFQIARSSEVIKITWAPFFKDLNFNTVSVNYINKLNYFRGISLMKLLAKSLPRSIKYYHLGVY